MLLTAFEKTSSVLVLNGLTLSVSLFKICITITKKIIIHERPIKTNFVSINSGTDKEGIWGQFRDNFCYFSIKHISWVLIWITSMSTPSNICCGYSLESLHRDEAILMNIHNIMFLWRTVQNYPSIITKYPPYLFHCINYALMAKIIHKPAKLTYIMENILKINKQRF